MLDLAGGMGAKPRKAGEPSPPPVVFDPSPEELREFDASALWNLYGAMVEFDASGGRVRRNLRRELGRRGLI